MAEYVTPIVWTPPRDNEIRIFHYFWDLPPSNVNCGHIGFAYYWEGQWRFLHMQLNGMSTAPMNDGKKPVERLGSITPLIPGDPVHHIAALNSTFERKSSLKKIPYVPLISENTIVDNAGDFIFDNEGEGLTCSTFIVVFFTRFKIKLLKLNEWQGKEDAEFHKYLVDQLQKIIDKTTNDGAKKFAKRSLELVKKCPHAPRIKPQHVLGALLSGTYPVGFSETEVQGNSIMGKWQSSSEVKSLPAGSSTGEPN